MLSASAAVPATTMEATAAPTVGAAVTVDAARVAVGASSTIATEVASAVPTDAAAACVAVEISSTVKASEPSVATNAATVKGAAATEPAPVKAMAASGEETAITPRVAPETRVCVEPWAGSNEESTREPLRSIVAVRCASIRRVVIVAIGADWGCAFIYGSGVVATVHWAYSYPDRNLCTCQRSRNQANSS
jgi:hypothetical protein